VRMGHGQEVFKDMVGQIARGWHRREPAREFDSCV
jgi:hypothetical protein